jgi:hypothetical protein
MNNFGEEEFLKMANLDTWNEMEIRHEDRLGIWVCA